MNLGPGAKAVLMLAGLTVVIWGLHEAASLLVPLVTAVFITVVSLPVVRWLTSRGVPRWVAILLAVLFDLAILFGFGGLVGGTLNEFYGRVDGYQARLGELTTQTAAWVEHRGLDVDPENVRQAVGNIGVMDLVADLFQRLWALGSRALLVGLLVLFMLFESGPWRMKLAYVMHRPSEELPRFQKAAREVQTYLVVKSGLSAVTGALCGAWVAICGVDFPILWGLLAFFLNYIPTLGMFIATIPPVVVALIQFGPGSALLVLAGYLVINFTLGNFVEPRIMGRALGLSPLVVFLSMVFWGLLWGPVGALLAVPLTMVIKILLANTEDLRWAAVLLGSSDWFAEQRREWQNPFEAEKRRSMPPPAPVPVEAVVPVDAAVSLEGAGLSQANALLQSEDLFGDERRSVPPSARVPVEAEAFLEDNPPLHTEDPFQGSGLRPKPDTEDAETA